MAEDSESFLGSLKAKYSEFINSLAEKGFPSPQILVPLIVLILIGTAVYFASQSISQQTKPIALSVKDSSGIAVPNVKVSLIADGKLLGTFKTDENGAISFSDVPSNAKLSVKIVDDNLVYSQLDKEISFSDTDLVLSLSPDAGGVASDILTLVVGDSSSSAIAYASVRVTSDDGTKNETSTDQYGTANFAFPKFPSHLTLSVSASGYQAYSASLSSSEIAAGYVSVKLVSDDETDNRDKNNTDDSQPSKFGKVLVSVSSGTLPVEDAVVSLQDSVSFKEIKIAKTDASGVATFTGIPLGKEFYVSVAESNVFSAYSSFSTYLLSSSTIPLEIETELQGKDSGASITVQAVTESGDAISGANFYLFKFDNPQNPQEAKGDSSGIAIFRVAKDVEFYTTAYAPDYAPASTVVSASSSVNKLALKKLTADNSAKITFFVFDKGEPASSASVSLYKSDGFFFGIPPVFASSEGTAEFTVPVALDGDASYQLFAKASKRSMKGETGRFIPEDGKEISVDLLAEKAKIEVSLLDVVGKTSISSGSVSILDYSSKMVASCEIANGKCTLEVPSEEELSIVATSSDYLQTSSVVTLSASESRKLNVYFVSKADSKSVSANFVGLFNSEGEVKEAGNAEYYTAKFLVSVPSKASEAGFHLHLSSDSALISEILNAPDVFYTSEKDCFSYSSESSSSSSASYSSSSSASSSSSSSVSSSNSSNQQNGFASVDLLFPKGFTGSKEVSFKIHVLPDAPASSSFSFNYKAYAIKDSLLVTSPQMKEFPSGEPSTQPSLSSQISTLCSSENFIKDFEVSESVMLCNDDASFCQKTYLQTDTMKSRKSIEVPLNDEFTFNYEILSTSAIDTVSFKSDNVKFVSSASDASFSSSVSDSSFSSTPSSSSSSSSSLYSSSSSSANSLRFDDSVPVSIEADKLTKGSVTFKAIRAADLSDFSVSFLSEGEEIQALNFPIKITGTNTMKVSVSPSQIVSGEEKPFRVSVLDSENSPITDALVTLYDCKYSPLDSEEPQIAGDDSKDSGEDGIYRFSLQPSSLGTVGVKVEQKGFRTSDQCPLEVSAPEDALSFSVSSVSFEGSSASPEPESVTVSSSISAKGSLSISSDCTSNGVPLLMITPSSSSNFRDSFDMVVELLPNVTAHTSCQIVATDKIDTKTSITASLPVRLSVDSPWSSTADTEAGNYPSVPSVIYMYLDDNGFADAYYSLLQIGETSYCEVTGANQNMQITADCTSKIMHISADYSSQQISGGFRQSGRITVHTSAGVDRTFTLVVSKKGGSGTNYNLQQLPSEIYFEIDPSNRYMSFMYSVSNFGEVITSASILNTEFPGISLENPNFYSTGDQRLKVIADFTDQGMFNRLLSSVYAGPGCSSYLGTVNSYGNQFYPQSLQRPPNSPLPMYQPGMPLPASNPYYQSGNPYSQYGNPNYQNGVSSTGYYSGDYWATSQQNPNTYNPYQFGGIYSSPSYRNGFSNGALYDANYLSSNANIAGTRFGNVPSGCTPSPYTTYLLINSRRIPIRVGISGYGGFGNQNYQQGYPYGPNYAYSPNGMFPYQQQYLQTTNAIASPIDVEIDPYTNERFAARELSIQSGGATALCKLETSPQLFAQVRQLQNNPQSGVPMYPQYSSNYPQPVQKPATSSSGVDASKFINNFHCTPITKDGQTILQYDFTAKIPNLQVTQFGKDYETKEDSVFINVFFPQTGTRQLVPFKFTIGNLKPVYSYEPFSPKNNELQFVLLGNTLGSTDTTFKVTDNMLKTDKECKAEITGADGATITASPSDYYVAVKPDFTKTTIKAMTETINGQISIVAYKPTETVTATATTSSDSVKVTDSNEGFEVPSITGGITGSLECPAVNPTKVSATLNFAILAPKYKITIPKDGTEAKATIVPLGELKGGSNLECSLVSDNYNDKLKGKLKTACKISSDGKIGINVDYGELVTQEKRFSDTLSLSLKSVFNNGARNTERILVKDLPIEVTNDVCVRSDNNFVLNSKIGTEKTIQSTLNGADVPTIKLTAGQTLSVAVDFPKDDLDSSRAIVLFAKNVDNQKAVEFLKKPIGEIEKDTTALKVIKNLEKCGSGNYRELSEFNDAENYYLGIRAKSNSEGISTRLVKIVVDGSSVISVVAVSVAPPASTPSSVVVSPSSSAEKTVEVKPSIPAKITLPSDLSNSNFLIAFNTMQFKTTTSMGGRGFVFSVPLFGYIETSKKNTDGSYEYSVKIPDVASFARTPWSSVFAIASGSICNIDEIGKITITYAGKTYSHRGGVWTGTTFDSAGCDEHVQNSGPSQARQLFDISVGSREFFEISEFKENVIVKEDADNIIDLSFKLTGPKKA